MRYLISYDLIQPGQKHTDLAKKLKKEGAVPILESQWALRRHESSAKEILEQFHPCLDSNDKMLVVSFDSTDWYVVPVVSRTKIKIL